jgi:peptide/nickel transport system permease protein
MPPPRSPVEFGSAEENESTLSAGPLMQMAAIETGPTGKSSRKRLGVGAWLALAWMVVVVGVALLAPILPLKDPEAQNVSIARQGIGKAGAILGGDSNGRDMLSRLAWGARSSLTVAVGAILLGFIVGGTLGLVTGYYRGKTDTVISVIFDTLVSIPAILIAATMVVTLSPASTKGGGTHLNRQLVLILAIGVVAVPLLGRITRASTLAWSEREFVLAARAQGSKNRRIVFREVLPNVLPAMFSIALLGIAVAIVAEAGLAVLGVGVNPPTPSWGNMIALERGSLAQYPYMVFLPSAMIFFTVLALNYLGDVVRARFDVREGGL